MTSDATLIVGDCLHVMPSLEKESVDAIVTDPPYGLGFMGKAWDHGVPAAPFWIEALRVAKPGAHLLAFGGTRTHHRLICAIEDAGWEIRDCLIYLYGSGFPKSLNLGDGRGTALKPAWEPIVLARKPVEGTIAQNVERSGTGAINVDACRIDTDDGSGVWGSSNETVDPERSERHPLGRWPANVILDEEAAALLDAQSGEVGAAAPASGPTLTGAHKGGVAFGARNGLGRDPAFHGKADDASRFFYTAKASRSEREEGIYETELRQPDEGRQAELPGGNNPRNRGAKAVANHHPTVKPIDLMQWLVRLVTPKNGIVLDPFMGSGSTGCAALLEGFRFIGIELQAEYVEIARQRVKHSELKFQPGLFD